MPRSSPDATPQPTRWVFQARFRRNAFGWKSEPAITRVKEAVTEIKAAARKDPRHGAEGAVLFLERVAPALEHVDGSSGAMGTAVRLAAIHCLTEGYGFDHGQRGRITARCDFAPGRALGPHPRDLHADMPKKMRRAAIRSAISSKAQADAIHVIDGFTFTGISTKVAAGLLSDLNLIGKHVLVVIPVYDQVLYKSFRNIPGVVVRIAPAFSAQDVVAADNLLFTRDSLSRVEEAWGEAVQS